MRVWASQLGTTCIMRNDCPAPDELAAFAAGELPAAMKSTVESHISLCESCLEAVGYLTSKAASVSEACIPKHPTLAEADQVMGGYRLVRLIGEGGMGEVWEAQQSVPVRRTVALKLLKTGMDTRQILTRFQAERQLLALMQHPCIAQMFDAGISDTGRPYFVMEYVDGVRITTYCDREKLGVRERLDLFKQVCAAVQHAHQKGVIHRDLKPSNVLVTLRDGKPLPKVIDFGLAKATTNDNPEHSLTELGTMLGTPAYASPEQMSMGAIDIDTRSDVYSLGALLYELLVGVLPFEAEHGQSIVELRQAIRDHEPARPSIRLSRLGERLSVVAQSRGVDAPVLRKQLRGDLDWIVMKALEKQRERRYASPHELSLDIDRFLNHEPLQARPPSTSYRVRKFVRRHRLGTAFAAIIAAVVMAFIAVTIAQSERVAEERDRATSQAQRAEAINAFMQETLGAADPWQTGKDMSVRETLQQAVRKIDTTFQSQPLLAAEVRHTIGKTYLMLGQLDESEPLLRSALETRLQLLGSEHVDVADSLAGLAQLYQQRTQWDEAEKYATDALQLRRKLLGDTHESVGDSYAQLAAILYDAGKFTDAAQAGENALSILERHVERTPNKVSDVLQLVATNTANGLADFVRAEELFTRAHAINAAAYGAEDLRTALAAGNLATHYLVQGNPQRAEQTLSAAIPTMKRHLGDSHPLVATYTENLGGVMLQLNRYHDALQYAGEALAIRRERLGEDNANVARTMINIGIVQRRAGMIDEAAQTFAAAVPKMMKAYGEHHPDVGEALYVYGLLRLSQELYAEAEELFTRAHAIQMAAFPDDHPNMANIRYELGRLYARRKAYAEAEAILLKAHAAHLKAYGAEAFQTVRDAEALAALYTELKQPQKAAQYRAAVTK